MAASAAAASAATALTRPMTALAAGDDGSFVHVADNFMDVQSKTHLRNATNDEPIVLAISDGAGTGLWGTSGSGIGVRGDAYAFENTEASFGVLGTGGIIGVKGQGVTGVKGTSILNGDGVAGDGVVGVRGLGAGQILPTGSSRAGIGVAGHGATGTSGIPARGGVFSSDALSQVRLVPSTAAGHPRYGAAGDLYLDANVDLWLCKGNKKWVQVA